MGDIMDSTPSREELIKRLQSFAEEVDGIPTIREMRADGPYSPYFYKNRFGSWHDALRAADIQPTHGVEITAEREELVEDIKSVDEVVDRPPRTTDIHEHGDYPLEAYDEEFESYIHALEEAEINPDEKQYRFSSVETPEEKKGSANIEQLRDSGPTPASEMPQGVSTSDRRNGVWKFNLTSGSTQPATPIFYLNEEHSPELILRRFFEENPHVLEYQSPHAIKIEIGEHQASWKDIGQRIVDDIVETGIVSTSQFENLAVIRVTEDDTLRYSFETSVLTPVDLDELDLNEEEGEYTGESPVWGFPREFEELWQALSENDGLLFSTQPGLFTHYVPVDSTVKDPGVMNDLWVEYDDDGARCGGIERPLPYVVMGADIQELSLPEERFAGEVNQSLDEEPIQWLGESALEPLLNSYGSIESYLRNKDRSTDTSPSGIGIEEDPSSQDVVEVLLELSPDELPLRDEHPEFEEVEQKVRNEAFREGIYEVYPGCAICGRLLEAPDGSIDLQAAHILPKADNGPDVLQNGLGLCSRHHWAFDHGWFQITPDYEIQVQDYPELEGYSDLSDYDGEYLQLPSQQQVQPHPKYIQQRGE